MSTRVGRAAPVMRKRPIQARSRATVDTIVEAAARVLAERGWAGFTTNAVADKAGVSIGSYYQYFPDKHALIGALRSAHLDDCRRVLQSALTGEKSVGRFVEELVDGLIAVHSVTPGLHRVLLDEAPLPEPFRDPDSAFEREYRSCFLAAIVKHRGARDEATDAVMGDLLSDAIDGAIHNAARRGVLHAPSIRNELVRMFTLYLSAPA